MRVKMIPASSHFGDEESGIRRVCQSYEKYGPRFGVEYVEDNSYELQAVHAGILSSIDNNRPIVSHLHGLYWTADYDAESWEYKSNMNVIRSARMATLVTVPSEWVAETLRRDMHIDPMIIPHGIEWDEWQGDFPNEGYVLWNKNRNMDVCSPEDIYPIAKKHPDTEFYATFAPRAKLHNIFEIGLIKHGTMREIIQRAGVYLSTTKETFGIGALEAMASGVPVLGYAHGGNLITVKHGVSGYLAVPGDTNDLSRGLDYCLKYRDTLGQNAREIARGFTWQIAVEKVAVAYSRALEIWNDRKRPHKIDPELYRRGQLSE